MKLDTPRSPCLSGGFPLLEKGGDLPWRGGYLGSWCLPYAPLCASLTDGNGLVFFIVVHHTTLHRKPTKATKAFSRIINVKLNKLFGNIVPPNLTIPAHRNIIVLQLWRLAVWIVIGSF